MHPRNVPYPSISLVLSLSSQSPTAAMRIPGNGPSRTSRGPPFPRSLSGDEFMNTVDDRTFLDTPSAPHTSSTSMPIMYEQDETAVNLNAALHSGDSVFTTNRRRRLSLSDTVVDLALAMMRKLLRST
ncbi:hypothetical protein BV22DRAFT_1124415 [Leucogyrophana mollusca]|uniref:Uncharacterized protein n=1 Tax=Leucogyrophana mollusca TaxID=85980 RepID=A0ACB8C173_9AGAM|nr:hypothetical protein BV22DRAFT_1124415 [Leucogyrophana mollusca]